MDATAKLGRNPVKKHRVQPEYRDEHADAGRDCKNLSREPKFSGANGDRNIFIFPIQLTTGRIDNLLTSTRLMCVVCVFFPFILGIKFVGRTSRGHTGFLIHLPSAVRAFIFLAREKDLAIPFPRRP